MRKIGALSLMAMGCWQGMPAPADAVSAFQGNDTGGIIAYSLSVQTDIRTARDCALRVLRQGREVPGGGAA